MLISIITCLWWYPLLSSWGQTNHDYFGNISLMILIPLVFRTDCSLDGADWLSQHSGCQSDSQHWATLSPDSAVKGRAQIVSTNAKYNGRHHNHFSILMGSFPCIFAYPTSYLAICTFRHFSFLKLNSLDHLSTLNSVM